MALTREYQSLLTKQRRMTPRWGNANRHVEPVELELRTRCRVLYGSILDYGAGTGVFKATMEALHPQWKVTSYEPGEPHLAVLPPGPFTAVVCTHVLEHVEIELLKDTVDEIESRAQRLIYIEVPHGPSGKVLPDGRDAHLIQQSREWWREFLVHGMDTRGWQWRMRPGENPINTQYIFWRAQ